MRLLIFAVLAWILISMLVALALGRLFIWSRFGARKQARAELGGIALPARGLTMPERRV